MFTIKYFKSDDLYNLFITPKMVFIGVLYQLPPVVSKEERQLFQTHYATPYFFSTKTLEWALLETVELEKVYRQKDQSFVTLLNKICNHSITSKDLI